jgi:hypothetical protein
MSEEQERRGRREDGEQAGDTSTAAPEPATHPSDEALPAAPAPSASVRLPQRHTVWRWHMRRRRRKK